MLGQQIYLIHIQEAAVCLLKKSSFALQLAPLQGSLQIHGANQSILCYI